jgi:hypothetical protein
MASSPSPVSIGICVDRLVHPTPHEAARSSLPRSAPQRIAKVTELLADS